MKAELYSKIDKAVGSKLLLNQILNNLGACNDQLVSFVSSNQPKQENSLMAFSEDYSILYDIQGEKLNTFNTDLLGQFLSDKITSVITVLTLSGIVSSK